MIKQNSVVTMHYELKDDQGEVLDSSKGQDPLVYLHGAGTVSYTHLTLPTKA